MGDGTEKSPYTQKDVLRFIEANGLDLPEKWFEEEIDLCGLNLQKAVLEKCHLEGAVLIGAHLEEASLREAHLENAYLAGAHLEDADCVGAHLENAELHRAHLEGVEFFGAHLERASLVNAFLDRARLSGAHLEGANLLDAKFSANTQMESVDWGNYILGEEIGAEEKGQRHLFRWAEDTYRRLKIWYTNAGMYDIAGEFFYREMTAKRKALKWRPNPMPRALSKLLSILCGYGERPLRAGATALITVLGLAVIYSVFGTFKASSSFWDGLYYSAVSFTAVGYGNWAPEPYDGWVKGIGVLEAFIGVFIMSLFLVTFTRKMTR